MKRSPTRKRRGAAGTVTSPAGVSGSNALWFRVPFSGHTLLWALALLMFPVIGCDREKPVRSTRDLAAKPAVWFKDVTSEAGIRFTHQVDVSGQYLYFESIGSGCAFLDFDRDDLLDVYLINNVRPGSPATNRLFHQERAGRFVDVTVGSGLDVSGFGNGLAAGDFNNDGLPEVLITEYDRVRFFLNLGGGKFRDITTEAGLGGQIHWSVPAAFVDYDRDGWLDLVIGNYIDFDPAQRCPDARGEPDFCGPHGFPSTITRLFRNRGSSIRNALPAFEDVSVVTGLARFPGKAMQIVSADFDGDHWPDIFITDDGLPNRLFINQRTNHFTEEAVVRGVAYTGMGAAAANMGIAMGDIDADGMFDMFVPHLAEEAHTLWRQGPRGVFQDVTAAAGLMHAAGHSTGFAALFGDFDCDGAPDLAILNGLVRRRLGARPRWLAPALPPFWEPYAALGELYANTGNGRFRDVSQANPALCSEALVGRGMACGDIDNDGGLDLLITGIGTAARLLRNVASDRGHWLGIRAIDPALGSRDAYGAEVMVRLAGGSRWGLVQPAYSYASSNDPRVHYGLGKADVSMKGIEVTWPDGSVEHFPGGAVDRYLALRKGEGQRVRPGQ